MLSHFIRKNRKHKGGKSPKGAWDLRCRRPPISPETLESPLILDIHERSICARPQEALGPSVQFEISDEPWFPEELLYARRSSKASLRVAGGFERGAVPSDAVQRSWPPSDSSANKSVSTASKSLPVRIHSLFPSRTAQSFP